MSEAIDLAVYPIWERQEGEPAEIFTLFERYFLPSPKCNLTSAYRRFVTDSGGDGRAVSDASGRWREYCKIYRWRERWESFWRWKNQSDAQWREEQIRRHHEQDLETAAELRRRGLEILAGMDLERTGAKDAAALLRLSTELRESALGVTDLDRAIRVVTAAGFEVVEPLDRPLD